MYWIALALTLLVALLHVYFLVLEMFLWTRVLAANQGLYNGFLAAGIGVGLVIDQPVLVTFSLACVVVAGCYGAYSVSRRIFMIQAVPAILALVFRAVA
jgi:putative membrane protein